MMGPGAGIPDTTTIRCVYRTRGQGSRPRTQTDAASTVPDVASTLADRSLATYTTQAIAVGTNPQVGNSSEEPTSGLISLPFIESWST